MPTHYETLGVAPTASAAEIRKAYLRRARALHPDRQLGRSPSEARAAEQAMRQVNVAWNVLSDSMKKAEYDKRVSPRRQTQTVQARPRPQTTPTRDVQPRQPHQPDSRASDERRTIDEEAGDGSVSVWASIPVLLVIGLLLGVLIITAFADREPADNRPVIERSTSELSVGSCFVLDGDVPRARSCSSGAADGKVVEVGPDPGNCPAQTFSIKDPGSELFLCWARMIPGSTNLAP